jgi:hypothetical protein
MSPANPPNPAQQTKPTGDRRAELERIRDATWPPDESPEGRQARIARNLTAWNNRPKWHVDPKLVRQILEDPDNDYHGS